MLTNDFIVEQSKMVIKLLTTVLVAPDGGFIEDVDAIKFSGAQLKMQKTLQDILEKNQICKAEDKVFEMLDENNEDGNICLALWFYNKLLQYDEDILDANDFGKDEILEGLRELEALKLPQ